MFVVVSYDISDDLRRNNVARVLKDYGTRVQYSVFEGNINKKNFDKMVRGLIQRIDPSEDNIRIYRLCGRCHKLMQVMGSGKVTEDEDVYIV